LCTRATHTLSVRNDEAVVTGLFDERETELLRSALAAYTVDGVDALLGPVGQAALGRAELSGVARQLPDDGPLATLVRLFLLGAAVPERCARAALEPLPLEAATAAGVLATSAGSARALVDIRPYAQAGGQPRDWWVVSDFGTDVRRGPLPADHVLGVGTAALTLAQATPRLPVGNALDVGTGSGIQALHLGTHADAVVATDVSARALRFAATTAALTGQRWTCGTGRCWTQWRARGSTSSSPTRRSWSPAAAPATPTGTAGCPATR
jgi:hypothetical protein